ncbi:hypothetical protein [Streptomyces sp. G-G2]|uniref:hypothetical protein n=1 Tax=Streptomyces sp. G-G2 TaxID=3046201 RepID=UPI0024B94100|nr:hypothetical protein [Streptomyces sp. G-G2]MDJ0382321.1 hypothetical protein [Streptomyces sp. G-G2]
MKKKYLVLPAVLLIAAAALITIRVWPSTLKDMRAQNVCLGMLTKETAGLLYDGKGGELLVDEDKGTGSRAADPVFSTICFVGRATGKSATTYRLQYTLDVRPTNTLNEPPKGATQIAGASGWVGPRQSEVQLPASCPKKMKTDTEHVTLTLKIGPGVIVAENWNDAALTAASRTLVLEAVDNLARQYDCTA